MLKARADPKTAPIGRPIHSVEIIPARQLYRLLRIVFERDDSNDSVLPTNWLESSKEISIGRQAPVSSAREDGILPNYGVSASPHQPLCSDGELVGSATPRPFHLNIPLRKTSILRYSRRADQPELVHRKRQMSKTGCLRRFRPVP